MLTFVMFLYLFSFLFRNETKRLDADMLMRHTQFMYHRLMLRISPPAYKWLCAEAKRLGIAVSELLRRIVDEKRKK